jgi:hypothetical protein
MSVEQLKKNLEQFFEVPARPKTWGLSPSSLSHGYVSCVFKVLDRRLPSKAKEDYKLGSLPRVFCGYVWEKEWELAHPDFESQVKLSYSAPSGYHIQGTADFIKVADGVATFVDTKCVADQIAFRLQEGDLSLGYHKQLQWYMQMHKLKFTKKPNEYTGEIHVLNRNYLNTCVIQVDPFTEKEWALEVAAVDKLAALIRACVTNDVVALQAALLKAVDYVNNGGYIHPYSSYEPHGLIFKWKERKPVSVKPKTFQKYYDAISNYNDANKTDLRDPSVSDVPGLELDNIDTTIANTDSEQAVV